MKKTFLILGTLFLSILCFSQDPAITTTSIHLRDSAAQTSQSLDVIPSGTIVYTENCKGDWCEVSYQGQTGYVNIHYLKYNSSKPKEVNVKASPTSPVHYYTNVDGNTVQSPTHYDKPPQGATAQCGDGTYSFSQHRKGTCSHHGGVTRWL